MNTLSWGILGTGQIATLFAKNLPQSKRRARLQVAL